MKSKYFFSSLSNTVIVLNILIGLGSIFLVDRIKPAINDILNENARTVEAAFSMLELISNHQIKLEESNEVELENATLQKSQTQFWQSFDDANKNVTLEKESEILDEVKTLSTQFWLGEKAHREKISELITLLAELNLNEMKKKHTKAESLIITGAWGLGFLLIVSLVVQLVFRSKVLSGVIEPVEQIYSVLKEFKEGNQLRRFADRKDSLLEIKKIGLLMNSILDSSTYHKNRTDRSHK